MGLTKWYKSLTPEALFDEITFIDNEDTKRKLEEHCFAYNVIAVIDYWPERNIWIWHTSYTMFSLSKSTKPIATMFSSTHTTRQHREQELMLAVVQWLHEQGIEVDTLVPCRIGEIDIVSKERDLIFEVKLTLSRDALYRALGQVLLYRQCLNPLAQAFIIGELGQNVETLRPYLEALGVQLVVWPHT
jgi:hypothetical protein